jgi:hypothetical protein
VREREIGIGGKTREGESGVKVRRVKSERGK